MSRKKKTIVTDTYTYIKVTGIPMKLRNDIINITDNLGIDISSWCKIQLRKAADLEPEKNKLPKRGY